jgi:hypothetical protein
MCGNIILAPLKIWILGPTHPFSPFLSFDRPMNYLIQCNLYTFSINKTITDKWESPTTFLNKNTPIL